MGGLNGNHVTFLVALHFASYIVRDYGYPLMSWYLSSFKARPLGIFSMKYEHWFNRKHSSTCMSVERGSRIWKAHLKRVCVHIKIKNLLPMVVYPCWVQHNILLASKDQTLYILMDTHLPPIEDNNPLPWYRKEELESPRLWLMWVKRGHT